MSIKSFLIFISCLFLKDYYAFSQEPLPKDKKFDHFLEIGLGLNYHATRDESTSPLTYRGYQPAIHLQYFFRSQKFQGIIEENFFLGNLKNRNFGPRDKNKAMSYNNELSFTAFYNVKNLEKSHIFVGGEFGTLSNVRQNDKYNNANINYEIMASLSPSAMFEYRTNWKAGKVNLGLFSLRKRDRDFVMQYALSVPVFSTIFRPGFVTISDFVDDNSQVVDPNNFHFTSFNRLFLVKNRINLYYILHNNNMLKFNYNFSYYSHYSDHNPVKGFHSTFFVSIVFRFTNNLK